MPELKLYTVAQIHEWLVNNKPAEGLSERVIAPTRAWAIIHNPYVMDDDAIVAAIFEDGQLAAYTASFPDMLEGKRIWWASTLYCYPQFAGRGYGMIVVGSLMEAHEPDMTYDRWAAKETVEIFNHFGYQTIYTPRYHLSDGKIDTSSLNGKLAYCAQELKKSLHPWPKQSITNYALRYVSYIDGEAYEFMKAYRSNDLWLREQSMLNWILRYPFVQGCSLLNRTAPDSHFSSNAPAYDYKVVKVYKEENLIGVYVLRSYGKTLSIIYLYFVEECRGWVFDSIVDHMISIMPNELITENQELITYVREHLYYPKAVEEHVSLSLPADVLLPIDCDFQLADGDSFA